MSQRTESPLRELCRGVMPAPDPGAEHARRERIAGRVLELQRQLGRQRRVRRRAALASALAALLGGALSLLLWLKVPAGAPPGEPGVRLLSGQASSGQHGEVTLAPGPLALGEAPLVTPEHEGAELLLSSETALVVAPASRVKLERRARAGKFEERVRLVAGRVALQVPKLGQRGTVYVETGDALVEVHGTRFSVHVVPRAPLPPFTEVAVEEGRVHVRGPAGERMLGAGERWSSASVAGGATVSSPPAPEPVAAEPAVSPSRAAPSRAAPSRAAPSRAASRRAPAALTPSELAAQNRLLEAAELARKNGLPELALERLAELIRRHPSSEHAHSARVTRFRLLRELGRDDEASAAARQYLELHPRGFARGELEAWLRER